MLLCLYDTMLLSMNVFQFLCAYLTIKLPGVLFVDVYQRSYSYMHQSTHMNLKRVMALDGNMTPNQSMTGAP